MFFKNSAKKYQDKNHKYLQEFSYKGELPYPYSEKKSSPFDIRETYGLDITMIAWLYERLRFFQEEVTKRVDLEYNKVIIDEKEFTLKQCIDRMVNDCSMILKITCEDKYIYGEEYFRIKDKHMRDLFKVLTEVYWLMWW